MKKILIWGAGGMAVGLCKCFDQDKAQVTAFIDKDRNKHGMKYHGIPVMGVEEALLMEYDFVFISSITNQEEIFEDALLAGIDREKLVSASITRMELGRVYDLFTEKGMMYISHLKTEDDIWRIKGEIRGIKKELNITSKIVRHIENIHKEYRMRYTNLF